MTEEQTQRLIRECQVEAQKSIDAGDPPFACIITDTQGTIVMRAHNTQNTETDPTAHAEINALRRLGKQLKTRYLDGYVMFSNASSCSMCISASIKAHVTQFYFGALPEQSMDPWLPMEEVAAKAKNPIVLHGPILGEECAAQIAQGRSSSISQNPKQRAPSE